jgi:hypothetical protein
MKTKLSKKFFFFLFLILIFLSGFIFWKRNLFSKEVLRLEIIGPTEAVLGQEVEYVVKYKNNGNFRLENPELIFEPPENSLSEEKIAQTQIFKEEKLGSAIYPGEEKSFSFRLRLFGKEGEAKIAKASLSYRPKNLMAKYTSQTSFTTVLKPHPLTFEFDFPSKVEPGRNFNLRINYFSSVDFPLSNLRIEVEYPSGFEFISSNPPSMEKNEWEIPLLTRGDGGRVEILGKILGNVGETKIFRAKLSLLLEGKLIPLKETEKGIGLMKPSLYLRQEINGNPEYVASPGEWLHYEIYFKNVGGEELTNLSIIDKLEGEAFDFQSLKSELGECRPADTSVIFDWRNVPQLQRLLPSEEGKVDFWVKVKDDLSSLSAPILKNKVFVGEVKEEFLTKISAKLEIVQKGYYYDEIFGNSGPLPPEVGKETTYTIVWRVNGYYSSFKEVTVKATLPPEVNLTGKIFPEELTSKFSFDPQSREVVWTVGDLGGATSPQLAFQISFSPKENQRGTKAILVGEATASGEDSWTGKILETSAPPVDTSLPYDQNVKPEMGTVK